MILYNRSNDIIHIQIITIDITIVNIHIHLTQFTWSTILGRMWLFIKPLTLLTYPFYKVSFISVSILSLYFINYYKPFCCVSVWIFIESYLLLTSPLSTTPSIFLNVLAYSRWERVWLFKTPYVILTYVNIPTIPVARTRVPLVW